VLVARSNNHKIRDECNYYCWFLMLSAISGFVTRAWFVLMFGTQEVASSFGGGGVVARMSNNNSNHWHCRPDGSKQQLIRLHSLS
jgi:hypothetical protein